LFKPLTLEEITVIVDLLLADLSKWLADRRVTVKLDKKAKGWAAEKGCDPAFGARPLKRVLQRNIETKSERTQAVERGASIEDRTKWCALTSRRHTRFAFNVRSFNIPLLTSTAQSPIERRAGATFSRQRRLAEWRHANVQTNAIQPRLCHRVESTD
jgi:hypothetical protein